MKTTLARFLLLTCVVSCSAKDDTPREMAMMESTSLRANAADEAPPAEEDDKPADVGEGQAGGTGTAMALDEGKMGKRDPGNELARQQAIEQARTAGILGSGRYGTIGHGSGTGQGYGIGGGRMRGRAGTFDTSASSEGYAHHDANAWTDASKDRLSTFAADVDTASYTLVRRKLLDGALPPRDAVRVEEMVNYFTYTYPAPAASAPFSVTSDLAPSPFHTGRHILRVGVSTRAQDVDERRPAHLVFLVDVSGSMQGADRLLLAQRSLRILVDTLKPTDTVALVTYAGATRVVLPATSVAHKHTILAAIEDLQAGGSTAMADGISLAYREAMKGLKGDAISRVIILSDGDANVGTTSDEAILASIAAKVKEGVTLSTIGFGVGNYQDARMEQLANKGNGNNYYIDGLSEAKRVFQQQVGATLEVVAKDVKLQVDFDPTRVKRYRLVGYENRDIADNDFRNDRVDAGEIGPGHQVTAIYELELVAGTAPPATVRVRHKTRKSTEATEAAYPVAAPALPAFAAASDDLRFAFAVAAFGDVLRGAKQAADWDLAKIRALAAGAAGTNKDRGDFVQLVDKAIALQKRS